MRHTISNDTAYNINHFQATPEVKAILEPIKEGNHKSPHLANFDIRYLGDSNKDTEMPDIKHIIPISNLFISERTTSTRSRSDI